MWECLHSLRWSLNRSTQPKPGEPSACGHCAASVIFTDELTLRALDWPDSCLSRMRRKGIWWQPGQSCWHASERRDDNSLFANVSVRALPSNF